MACDQGHKGWFRNKGDVVITVEHDNKI
jgi:hypothetical protein